MTYANNNYYKPGSWNVICDVCGIRHKADEVRKRWDGLLVCKNDWEPDHPQKYLRVRDDPKQVPFIRPEPADTFTEVIYPDAWEDFGGPTGIYVMNTTDRANNTLKNAYLSGYTIRCKWSTLNPADGVYDFSLIEEAMPAAQARGQKVTLEIFARNLPAFVKSNLTEDLWADHRGFESCVPWDANAKAAWETFIEALATQLIPQLDGTTIAFADHPALETVDASIIGMQSVRDLLGTLVLRPDYTREKLIQACVATVQIIRDWFPNKYTFIGVFPLFEGGETGYRVDYDIIDTLLDTFVPIGTTNPKLGFFQETLSDIGPEIVLIGSGLRRARKRTWVMFQALTNWSSPWTGADKVTSGQASVGIEFAYKYYGAKYLELYEKDASDENQQDNLYTWARTLTNGAYPQDVNKNPEIIITEPDYLDVMTGTFNITTVPFVYYDSTMVSVKFYANGTLLQTDTIFPYGYAWNTLLTPDGEKRIETRATDSAGRIGVSYRTAVVQNGPGGPFMDLLEPDDNELTTTSRTVKFAVYAVDLDGVQKVEFFLNGSLRSTQTSGTPYTYITSPSDPWISGINTMTIIATDNTAATSEITVEILWPT